MLRSAYIPLQPTVSLDDCQRQWHRDDLEGHPDLARELFGAVLHCTGKITAERVRRELQRPVPGRMSQLASIPQSRYARAVIDTWRADYNAVRPHAGLNGMTPEAFAQHANKAYNDSQTLT